MSSTDFDAPNADATTTTSTRRDGINTILSGAGFALLGTIGLWVSFWLAGGAKTILGAGPLIGGGMIGYGATQAVLGDRLRFLRWVASVIAGLIVLAAVFVLLESTLGVTFE